MRLHSRGVTRADLFRSFLELSFALSKNIVPLIEKRGLSPSFVDLLRWVGTHPELPTLAPRERHRLVGLLMAGSNIQTYAEFRATLSNPDLVLESVGRRALFGSAHWEPSGPNKPHNATYIAKLESDIVQYLEARDFYKAQSEAWEKEAKWVGTMARAKRRLSRFFRF
jgi:hypothetical protein